MGDQTKDAEMKNGEVKELPTDIGKQDGHAILRKVMKPHGKAQIRNVC